MPFVDRSYAVLQGQLFGQLRSSNAGNTGGFLFLGDADKFNISPTQKFVDIQESQTGLGLTSLHAPVETAIKVEINLLSIETNNWVKAMWGSYGGAQAGGTVTGEALVFYPNSLIPLVRPGVSAVVINVGVNTVTVTTAGSGYTTAPAVAFTGGTGSGGTAVATVVGGLVTAVTVTAGGSYSVAPTGVTFTGGGGSLAAGTVSSSSAVVVGVDYTVDATNGALTVLPGSLIVTNTAGANYAAAYTYAAYTGRIDAFTIAQPIMRLRLHGVNTANVSAGVNQPIIANCYQFAPDMAKMFDLIGKKNVSFDISGMLLQDTSLPLPSPTNPFSQFFNIVKG